MLGRRSQRLLGPRLARRVPLVVASGPRCLENPLLLVSSVWWRPWPADWWHPRLVLSSLSALVAVPSPVQMRLWPARGRRSHQPTASTRQPPHQSAWRFAPSTTLLFNLLFPPRSLTATRPLSAPVRSAAAPRPAASQLRSKFQGRPGSPCSTRSSRAAGSR